MKDFNPVQILLSVLILVLSSLFGWSLTEINGLKSQLADLREEDTSEKAELAQQLALMQQTLDSIAEDTGADASQDSQIKKHWTIVSRHRDWINELRYKLELEPKSWPDMSDF